MAEDQERTGPSLEPPSLFRRRRKNKDAAPDPAPAPAPVTDDSPTTILDEAAPTTRSAPAASRSAEWSAEEHETSHSAHLDDPQPTAAPAPVRRQRTGPPLPGRVAAALAGLVAGAVIVGLTSASFELCSRVRGTNSCGGSGIFLLVAVLVVAVVVGTVVLRLCRVAEPGSTSFLAVGLTSVVALLFLVDLLFEWWMVIVIPVVSVATFLLSHWVTATFVEPDATGGLADEPEAVDHDVR